MKRFLCLLLTAILLLGTIPAEAFAAEGGIISVIVLGNEEKYRETLSGDTSVGGVLSGWDANWNKSYDFVNIELYLEGQKDNQATGAETIATELKDADVRAVKIYIASKEKEDIKEDEKEEEIEDNKEPVIPVPTTLTIEIKADKSENVIVGPKEITPANGTSVVVQDVITYHLSKTWESDYEFDHAWSSVGQTNVARTDDVQVGDTLSIMLKTKVEGEDKQPENPTPESPAPDSAPKVKYTITFNPNYNTAGSTQISVEEGTEIYSLYTPSRYAYSFAGWYKDAKLTTRLDEEATVTQSATYYAKWIQNVDHEVFVKFYTNGNTKNVVMCVDLHGYAQDGVITLDDLSHAANQHIKAHSNAGLSVYGPFDASQWERYCLDNYYRNPAEKIFVNDHEKTVIYAMVHNVLVKSSGSKGDPTLPKTGDFIYAPVIIMVSSACALAYVFLRRKKNCFFK